MGFWSRLGLGVATLALIADPVASWFITGALVPRDFGTKALVAVTWAILDVIVGMWIVRYAGFATVLRASRSYRRGEPVEDSLVDGLMIVVAGLLVVWPGLLSDAVALVLLLPPSRWVARAIFRRRSVVGHDDGPPPPGVVDVDDYRVD